MSFIDLFKPFYYLLMNIITALVNIIIRRDETIILMGAWYGYRFADNSRYLFQYLHENKESYGLKKVIWATRSKELYATLKKMGYEVYMMKSAMGIYYHFKAGIHALNVNTSSSSATGKAVKGDLMGELSMGAKRVYLTHGVVAIKGTKFLEDDQSAELSFLDKFLIKLYKFLYNIMFIRHFMLTPGGWDKVLFLASTQETALRNKARSVDTKAKKYVVAGFPELCEPLKYMPDEEHVLNIIKMHKTIILYVPTYRTNEKIGFKHPLDSKPICKYLRDNHIFWIDKLHPGASKSMEAREYPDDISMLLRSDFDMNIIMRHADVIISDYSSVIQNAVYYRKPIVNFWGDMDGYIKYGNGVERSFFNDVVGEKAYTIDELIKAIENALSENYFSKYDKIYNDKFAYFFDNRISNYEETANKIFELLKEV